MQYDAIILAGGQGSRLGGLDKARLMLAGTELVRRPLAAVRDAARVVVVGPPSLASGGVLPDGVLLTREDPPGGGPAAATAAGLELLARISPATTAAAARPAPMAPWVVLLSCDLPLADAGLPHLLAAADITPRSSTDRAKRGHGDVAGELRPQPNQPPDGYCLTGADGHLQWLFAIYRSDALLRAVRDCPQPAGTSMRRLLAPLRLIGIPNTAEVSADLDTWDDHAAWTAHLRKDTP